LKNKSTKENIVLILDKEIKWYKENKKTAPNKEYGRGFLQCLDYVRELIRGLK
jgi:hypothetical protein